MHMAASTNTAGRQLRVTFKPSLESTAANVMHIVASHDGIGFQVGLAYWVDDQV